MVWEKNKWSFGKTIGYILLSLVKYRKGVESLKGSKILCAYFLFRPLITKLYVKKTFSYTFT